MTKHWQVSIVDDDQSVRESLLELLTIFGFAAEVYPSAEDFLQSSWAETGCLILDVAMPGMSGQELQLELKRRGSTIPIIFITAHGDELIRPYMVERGAVDCLFKPFTDESLLGAINAAFRAS